MSERASANSGHTLSILVRNEPGVLTKIAGTFYRRGFNIETLTVGKTHIAGLSKILISVPGDPREIEFLRRQIENLVDVHQASLLDSPRSILMEVCLIRIAYDSPAERRDIMTNAQPYLPRIVAIDDQAMTLEIAERPVLVDDFVTTMTRHRILDVSRTGMTALGPPQAPVVSEPWEDTTRQPTEGA